MNRNSLLFILIIILSVSFWVSLRFVLDNKPELLSKLEKEQTELNEQYISAKILAEKLDQVYTLFSENLALSLEDSLAEDSSIPFLKNITDIMNKYDVSLLKIMPKPREKLNNYYVSLYEMKIKCTYEKLGKFLTEIEQSPRLIAVNNFSVKNGLERIKRRYNEEELLYQIVDLDISTLTLIKSKTSHI